MAAAFLQRLTAFGLAWQALERKKKEDELRRLKNLKRQEIMAKIQEIEAISAYNVHLTLPSLKHTHSRWVQAAVLYSMIQSWMRTLTLINSIKRCKRSGA